MSIWFTEVAASRISSLPGSIAGVGMSVRAKFSGPPKAFRICARMMIVLIRVKEPRSNAADFAAILATA